jgi:hypothetical protein
MEPSTGVLSWVDLGGVNNEMDREFEMKKWESGEGFFVDL